MTCNRFRTLIQQRFDQDLSTQDHRALINHLEGCESCAKFDHQLDQMIQAAQDTPAPDEVRPQNPEALARLIMEQLPQKKGSIINLIMGLFGGGGGGKPKAAKKGPVVKDVSSAVRDKPIKSKGKEKSAGREQEADRRPGGVTFGRKNLDHVDNDAIESQVGTFSRLKSISNRTPEQLDREAQSTTRSLGEKFGMPGANTILDEGPLTLAESIKRKVSESQRMSPLDDDADASGSLSSLNEAGGASSFGRPEGADNASWGSPAQSQNKPQQFGAAASTQNDSVDWGGSRPNSGNGGGVPTFANSAPVGFDEHPGSSIGLAAPGSKRTHSGMAEQPIESGRAGIGLAPASAATQGNTAASSGAAPSGMDWGTPATTSNEQSTSASGAAAWSAAPANTTGGGWGATETSKPATADSSNGWGTPNAPAAEAPAQPANAAGWTSGWGGEGQASAPLKSSDSWAVPGSESTASWGQPGEGTPSATGHNMPASAPAPTPAPTAADPWAPASGAWGGGQAAADAAQAAAAKANTSSNDAWGAVANSTGSGAAADPWGVPASTPASQPASAPADSHTAPAPASPAAAADPWGAPATAAADPWGSTGSQSTSGSGAAVAPAPSNDNFAPAAQADAWGAAVSAPAPAAQADAWGAAVAAPVPAAQTDAWGAAVSAPAPAAMSAPVAPSAPAPAADPWGSPVQAAAQPDAWGAAAAPAANSWGNAPAASTPITSSSDAWTAAAAPSPAANPATDAAGAMAAQYSTIPPGQFATPANAGSAIASSGWGQAAVPPAPLDSAQIEAKKNAWAAEAEQLETGTWKAFAPKMNEGLGGKPAPLPASGPAPAASPAGDRWDVPIQERNKTQIDQPMPTMGAPVAAAPVAPIQPNANAAAGRWDVPIQERPKTDEAIAAPPAVSAPVLGTIGMPPGAVGSPVLSSGIPVNQIVEKMGQVLGGQSSAASAEAQESRWDVPIQERMKNAQVSQEMQPVTAPAASSWGQPAANAAPAAPVEAAPAAPAADANAWGASASSWGQEAAPVAAANSNQAASGWNSQPAAPAASGWGGPATAPQTASGWDAPAAAPAASSWDAPAAAPTASSWDAQPAAAPAASGWDSQPAATPAASGWDAQPAAAPAASSWDAQPAAAPAASSWDAPAAAPAASGWDAQPAAVAAPSNGGWGAGDAVAQPQAQPTSTWGQSAGNSWGDSAAISQQNQVVSQAQSPVGSAAWGAESNNNSWGQPAAPMGNSWASGPQASQPSPSIAPAPPAPPAPHAIPSVKPEVTDKVQGGGLLSGIDDKAIDRIFGEIGVQESVSKGLVNSGAGSGAEPESNFSPPASPAPQEMAATVAPPPQVFSQAAAPEAPKGLLGGIDDNAIDRIFSQNLGVSEPSVPVGAAPAAVANANAAPGNTWQSSVPAPVPTPMATPDVTQNSGWGAPPANTGWGQPPAQTAADLASAPVPPAPAQNSGWGTPPAPGQWGQPAAQAPAAEVMPANGTPKLFSVDDSVMDRIFADNLGIPQDSQPPVSFGQTPVAAPGPAPMPSPAQAAPPEVATPYQAGPPPKIEGIGRLDASADANQDAGSGRIASIGKFLLDQKDLDKIGKLTNVDNNDAGKLRILTKENSDDLQALLGQIGAQKGVIGSVIVGHDGLLIANTMPGDMDAESVGVWALGVYMNTEHVTKKMGHERVHQVVSRTPRGYVIIADFGGGLLVCVTEGKDTDSLIPLMRTITQLVN